MIRYHSCPELHTKFSLILSFPLVKGCLEEEGFRGWRTLNTHTQIHNHTYVHTYLKYEYKDTYMYMCVSLCYMLKDHNSPSKPTHTHTQTPFLHTYINTKYAHLHIRFSPFHPQPFKLVWFHFYFFFSKILNIFVVWLNFNFFL